MCGANDLKVSGRDREKSTPSCYPPRPPPPPPLCKIAFRLDISRLDFPVIYQITPVAVSLPPYLLFFMIFLIVTVCSVDIRLNAAIFSFISSQRKKEKKNYFVTWFVTWCRFVYCVRAVSKPTSVFLLLRIRMASEHRCRN